MGNASMNQDLDNKNYFGSRELKRFHKASLQGTLEKIVLNHKMYHVDEPTVFTKLPDFPPCFSVTHTPWIAIPRSAALHMS